MTTPIVSITGDELLDVLNSFEGIALDKYVTYRQHFPLDHERTKLFMRARYVSIETLQHGLDLGVTFDQMANIASQEYLLPNVLYVIDKVGSSIDEAIEAQEAYTPMAQLRSYVKLRTERGVSHETILGVIRDARQADVWVDDVIRIVFDYGHDVGDAIEAMQAGIFYLDYVQYARAFSHEEAIAWHKREKAQLARRT